VDPKMLTLSHPPYNEILGIKERILKGTMEK
jgi:hypothetical protein